MDGIKTTPAIVRSVSQADMPIASYRDTENKIISTPTDTVTFRKGFGETGYRTQIVTHTCPECQFDRMVRRVDINVEFENEVRYWCLNPNCVHFVSNSLSHDCHGSYPQHSSNMPSVFEVNE